MTIRYILVLLILQMINKNSFSILMTFWENMEHIQSAILASFMMQFIIFIMLLIRISQMVRIMKSHLY